MIKKIKPKAGQESVWDYPRPPRIEVCNKHLRIVFNDKIIADCNESFRVLETSHPPTYYIPKGAFVEGVLQPTEGASFCEFKGRAQYYNIMVGEAIANKAAWGYPEPTEPFAVLKDTVSVYAHLMDACYVNDKEVKAQEGDFYGGWITDDIVGPFKGAPGTWGW